jgi:hypothetical protein
MPPTTQRRNTAYLNRRVSRFGRQDRDLDDQTPIIPGLAIDLGGSVERLFRPTNCLVRACDREDVRAPRERRERCRAIFVLLICAF